MKVIVNSLIPFSGFKAMNLFGILFVRKEAEGKIDETCLNHERIHTAQIREMLYVFFYIWYFAEWAVRLFMKGNAYRNISFEKEAYKHESDFSYLSTRKKFAWLREM